MKKKIIGWGSLISLLGIIYLWTILKGVAILDSIEDMFDHDDDESEEWEEL
jgi:hypothetical protein